MQQRVKVCPLRDFAREAALMEQQLDEAVSLTAAGGSGLAESMIPTGARTHRRARAAAMVSSAQAMSSKAAGGLSALFRPPTDIAYVGSFATARKRATEIQCWLLVNVQDDSFNSQVLNRDVWSDKELRKLIRRQFMLWQVDADSSEGRRFVAFYHVCNKLPYVCVIDPRTGEEIWKSSNPKQSTILPDLKQFLLDHKDFSSELQAEDDNAPSTSTKRQAIVIDDDIDNGPSTSSSNTQNSDLQHAKKRSKIMELSEQEQIALAIRNSMRENGGSHKNNSDNEYEDNDDDDFGSVEEFGEEDTKAACEQTSYEVNLGSAKNELTMLKLRLLDVKGSDEIVQLRWPSDTKMQVLRQFIAQCHSHIAKQPYKLICAFPRKTLESSDDNSTLKELGLHPSANLHVNLDD